MKESYIFLAEGFEEIEAITPIDVLRRAGMMVKTVSVSSSLQVTGAHGVTINADFLFEEVNFENPAWLILPGGLPGASNLYEFEPLRELLKKQFESKGGRIAAICASPAVVLGEMGLLQGREATCYPGFEGKMKGADSTGKRVVRDDKFVLGAGPAIALEWALAIAEEEKGEKIAEEVASGMLLRL